MQIFIREDITACEDIGPGLVSYCDAGDIYCDNQGNDTTVHGSYFGTYDDDVVNFIVSRYSEAGSTTTSGAAPTSSTGTPTGTMASTTGTGTPTGTGAGQPEETDSGAGSMKIGVLSLVSIGLATVWQVL